MKIGYIIKAERLKLGMKQIVLAKGICTPSYLSRIEQNQIKASNEVISLLLERLGIQVEDFVDSHSVDDKALENTIMTVYKEAVIERNLRKAQEKLHELEQSIEFVGDSDVYFTFRLVAIRLRLIAGEDLMAIEKELVQLECQLAAFSQRQQFTFLINAGILSYKRNNVKEAIISFEHAIDMNLWLGDWEQADMNYMMALSYVADDRMAMAIDYIELALEYFQDKLQVRRILDCYLLKGIFYKRKNKFNDAEKCYMEALAVCENFHLTDRLGSVYHNLGALYLSAGRRQEGIDTLLTCFQSNTGLKSKVTTALALVAEYSKSKDVPQVIRWCSKGLELCLASPNEGTEPFYHHFTFYMSIHDKHGISEKVAKQTVMYFTSLRDYRNAQKYSISFAEEAYKRSQYKLASYYFAEANKYSYLNNDIKSWEDL